MVPPTPLMSRPASTISTTRFLSVAATPRDPWRMRYPPLWSPSLGAAFLSLKEPRFESTARATLIFDDVVHVVNDPDRELREFWDRMPIAAGVFG